MESVFDKAIIFSEYSWIGKIEENPEEKSLSFPSEIFKELS